MSYGHITNSNAYSSFYSVVNLKASLDGHRSIQLKEMRLPVSNDKDRENYELLKDKPFVNSKAYEDAIETLKYHASYQLQIGAVTIYLEFVHDLLSNAQKKKLSDLFNDVRLVIKKFFLINNHLLQIPKFIKLTIFTLPYINILTQDLSVDNLNSGYTIKHSEEISYIVIYKKYKMMKVLLHELYHVYPMTKFIDAQFQAELETYVNENFNVITNNSGIGNKILVNEAITEFLALYMQVIIVNHNKSVEEIKKLVHNEAKKTMKMSCTILKAHNISSIGQLYMKSKAYDPNKKLVQTTNAFSYYILAGLFLYNYEYILYKKTHKLKSFIELIFRSSLMQC